MAKTGTGQQNIQFDLSKDSPNRDIIIIEQIKQLVYKMSDLSKRIEAIESKINQ